MIRVTYYRSIMTDFQTKRYSYCTGYFVMIILITEYAISQHFNYFLVIINRCNSDTLT